MVSTLSLRVDPRTAATEMLLRTVISTQLNIDINRIKDVVIRRRSIDARQRNVLVNLSLDVYIDEEPVENPYFEPIKYADVSRSNRQAIIVGAGPAGLFAALRLIELGVRPIVLERGKDVDRRRVDMAKIAREDIVNPDSNYCFGEGGAGAFSDGKLYTRSKKRGSVEKILNILCQHGASTDILVDAHPHIGTDRLPEVIKAIRNTIINNGGEVKFDSRVTKILVEDDEAIGVETLNCDIYHGPVILASGHSARDLYETLSTTGIAIEPKGIAIGVRLEHKQALIDRIQYHSASGRGKYLPPAEYSMLTRVDGRAVYSFCMCPGGFIIPSVSGPNQQAVNGMSPSNRGTVFSNSGMVVEILPEDVDKMGYEATDPLKVMRLQEKIEKDFFDESGQRQNAPAQRMNDFVKGFKSKSLPDTSYAPGIHSARVDLLLPEFISSRLRKGFEDFGRKSRGFLTDDATVIGCETRTSAPVRIVRDKETLQSVTIKNLYPCGEGAGYAGGIVSAAIDGERVATQLAAKP